MLYQWLVMRVFGESYAAPAMPPQAGANYGTLCRLNDINNSSVMRLWMQERMRMSQFPQLRRRSAKARGLASFIA
jgi:hypothetical protein